MPKITATQFTVALANKPGQLAELTKVLSEKGINLAGLASETFSDAGFVRFVVAEKESEAKTALEAKGYKPTLTRVYQVEMTNQPGQLHQIAQKLGKQGINIQNLYCTATAGQPGATVFMAVEPFEKAQAILEKEALAAVR